ncbi:MULTISPECIES: DUF1772 domain-containing protein [Streptomyces]|uniref:Anthrone oxygenase family protein n=1 Tax=Streptomyces solicathayae TaxID=3081768 RepID=A0ABZ0LXX8_9ACTN|nr:anthrone oxygenase family protein [Streptomyces sp. HUAS YS2]WOX24289.1 anthrone oxygenase family protein [Streptomyces sp. HUAS YS2]
MPTLLLALAVGCTGLYAGFMLIFWTGIMPALGRLTDTEFVHAMRRINEYVPKPVFLVVFLGIVAFPVAALLVPIDGRSDTQKWLIVAGLACVVLNHLVTIAGNIPLNNALAASEGGPGDDPAAVRAAFESRWNALHRVRTLLITAGFGLLIAASLT